VVLRYHRDSNPVCCSSDADPKALLVPSWERYPSFSEERQDPAKRSEMYLFGQYSGNIPRAFQSSLSLQRRYRPAAPDGCATGAPADGVPLAGVCSGGVRPSCNFRYASRRKSIFNAANRLIS
jgi:hypothetical protein